MNPFRSLGNLPIRYKLLLGFSGAFVIAFTVGSIIIYSMVRDIIKDNIEAQLEKSTQTTLNMVRATMDASIKNHLRAVAEKNRDIVKYYYRQYKRGLLKEKAAKSRAAKVMLSQSIGKTGHIYCVNSNGVMEVNPQRSLVGVDMSSQPFIQEQEKQKEGYLEYEWKDPLEPEPRAKAIYMVYFEPWDWIVSASTYRDEFKELVNIEDFEESILELRFGDSGYSYVVDYEGNLLIHPKLQGRNYKDLNSAEATKIGDHLLAEKTGRLEYTWKNPGESESKDKLIFFNDVPELGWIVTSGGYLDEFYRPLESVRNIIIATFVVTLALLFPTGVWLSVSITRPLRALKNSFAKAADGDLSVRTAPRNSDEVGQLSRFFNGFMETLEKSNRELKEQVDERIRAEEAVRESEEKYRGIFENAVEGLFQLSPKGAFISANPATAVILGYNTPKELIATATDVEQQVYVDPARGRELARQMRMGHKVSSYELELYRKDGAVIWGAIHARPVTGEQGELVLIEGILEDITTRKEAEIELRRYQEQLEELVEQRTSELNESQRALMTLLSNLPGMAYRRRLDQARTMEFASEGAFDLTGYRPSELEEAKEQNYDALLQGDDLESFRAEISAALELKRPYELLLRLKRKDGQEKWVWEKGQGIYDDKGVPQALEGFVTDITARKRAEEALEQYADDLRKAKELQEENARKLADTVLELEKAKREADAANRSKSEFLANMSHEIRTPMNGILGMTDLSLRSELTPKQREYMNKIKHSARSLLGIINDILDFSKIEAGKMDLESTEFKLHEVMESLSDLFGNKAAEKGIEILISIDQDVPEAMVGDPLRLGQIFINLTNNAVKFTEEGEVVVRASIEQKFKDKVRMHFMVCDTGIGIKPDQISTLFSPFTQADGSTTRKFGGTGLGLSITRRLVEMMHGDIWAESEEGKGATFHFSAEFGYAVSAPRERQALPSSLKNLKVLVVDDNEAARMIIKENLEAFSFNIDLAASGEEALSTLRNMDENDPYQLLVLDWKMPGLDGIEVTELLRRNENLTELPIIMMTAFGREEVMHRAEKAGVNAFLVKPIKQSLLLDTIMEVYGERGAQSRELVIESSHSKEAEDKIRGASILLVEDNAINQEVASELLVSADITVTVAGNGKEAVDYIESGKQFDAVLMDIQMPVMDGFEATHAIRHDLNLQDLPVIAMTAHAMKGDREKCLEGGMDDYLTKPIDSAQLYTTLAKWVSPSSAAVEKLPEPAALVPEKSPEEEEILPEELPGIDIPGAMKRLVGKKKLLRKILLEFHRDHQDAATLLNKALSNGDTKEAAQLAHTYKGLSANISAVELNEVAIRLDACFKDEDVDKAQSLMPEFEKQLNAVMDTIGLIQVEAAPEQGGAAAAPIDMKVVTPLLNKLATLLEQNDFEAEDHVEVLEKALQGGNVSSELGGLVDCIGKFDFAGALTVLKDMTTKLGVDLKEG